MKIINCQAIADRLLNQFATTLEQLKAETGITPRLDVILVGDNPASKLYVNNKVKRCERVGIISRVHPFTETVTTEQLIDHINLLNHHADCHGLMVQLPLPDHIDSDRVIDAIRWDKDVDGLTSTNQAGLLNNTPRHLAPCTPLAVMEILKEAVGDVTGKNVAVIGRSRLFGKPMALMLQNANATVTMCHSRSDLTGPLKHSEIVISAIGSPKFFKADQFATNQTLIDVGINRDEAGKLCGDLDASTFEVTDHQITPVPGGVGVLTTTMLMANTMKAYQWQVKKTSKC